MSFRLGQLPATARLAIFAFVILVLAVHATAQATLWFKVGRGSVPGPADVLGKYHGHADRSRLHEVLDLSRSSGDPLAMYWYLDATSSPENLESLKARRVVILEWVEAGAPESGWPPVERVLHDEAMCLQCHGFGGEQYERAALETFPQVKRFAEPGRGISLSSLLVSAHNHVFAFAILGLVLGLATAFTGLRAWLRVLLVVAAFSGAALDVGGWFVTRAWGSPWEYSVILGGAVFGAATALMALAVLDEVALRGRLARGLGLGR